MTSTFRLLLAAMPDIATACEKINDPHLRDRAFDVLVAAAQEGATTGGASEPPYSGYYTPSALPGSFDPTSTRADNGRG